VRKLENDIEKKIGRHPDPYSANAYDAVWVAALTENASIGIQDIQIIKQNLYQIINTHFGLTGNLSLNKDGDRNDGIYDFGGINETDNKSGYEGVKDKNSNSNQLLGKMC
jgi:ABC-type branched-subunit amino acid transport system substrate-binding protein